MPVAEDLTVRVSEERVSGVVAGWAPGLAGEARVRRMVADHFDFIWRALRRLGLSPADAEDGAQEVFLIAARKLEQVVPDKERAYLFGAALRVASTQRRTAARRREQDDSVLPEPRDPGPGADEVLEQRRARSLLDAVLNELDLDLRTVFVLFELEEMNAPEIAELLEIPVGTVASRLRRARVAFRAAVQRLQRGQTRL